MRLLFSRIVPLLLTAGLFLASGNVFACGNSCDNKKETANTATRKSSCCERSNKKSDCCASNKNSTRRETPHGCDRCGGKNGCGGQCGGQCKCPIAASGAVLIPEVEFLLRPFVLFSGAYFSYRSPFLPNISIDIWLPPNILF